MKSELTKKIVEPVYDSINLMTAEIERIDDLFIDQGRDIDKELFTELSADKHNLIWARESLVKARTLINP